MDEAEFDDFYTSSFQRVTDAPAGAGSTTPHSVSASP